MKLIRLLSILLALIPVCLSTAPVFALDQPSSVSISEVYAFRNLAETGDMVIVFHYDIAYTSDNFPTTPASTAVMLRLVDTDNTTALQQKNPYVNPFFYNNGYGDGTGAFYLTADEAPTWGSAISIDILGIPAYFDPVWSQSYSVTPSDYTSETTQEANQELLKNFILLECDELAAAYEDTGIVLKSTSDIGIVLSPYGELYFRGVLLGLQNICPDLFFIQTLIPEQMEVTAYDMSQMDYYTDRLAGDDLGEGFTNTGALIGVSGSFFAAILVFIGGIGFCIYCSRKGWPVEVGMMITALIAIAMALIVGDMVFTIVIIVSLVSVIGLVWLVLLKRA